MQTGKKHRYQVSPAQATTTNIYIPVIEEGYHHYTNKQTPTLYKQTNNKKPAITRYTGRISSLYKQQHYTNKQTNKQTTKSQLLPVTQEGYHHYTNKQQHYTNKQTNNKKPAITRYTGRTSQQQQQQQRAITRHTGRTSSYTT